MTVPTRLSCLVSLLVVLGAGLPAAAQTPQAIGTYRDWTAFTYQNGNEKVCYMASDPKREVGDYSERGDAWTLVTHRSPGAKDVISIIAGYNYQQDKPVTVTIGNSDFGLFSQGDTAWTFGDSGEDDRAMVAAMKAGVDMVVVGYSWRGTKTTDTYSLLGFTAAYEAISKACPN